MSYISGVEVGIGLAAAFTGAAGAAVFGMPLVAVGVVAVSAGVAATAASALSTAFLEVAFKGSEAGLVGAGIDIVSHFTLVPASAIAAARYALKTTGFVP